MAKFKIKGSADLVNIVKGKLCEDISNIENNIQFVDKL